MGWQATQRDDITTHQCPKILTTSKGAASSATRNKETGGSELDITTPQATRHILTHCLSLSLSPQQLGTLRKLLSLTHHILKIKHNRTPPPPPPTPSDPNPPSSPTGSRWKHVCDELDEVRCIPEWQIMEANGCSSEKRWRHHKNKNPHTQKKTVEHTPIPSP